ncbi:hypothetical protein MA9V2_242 [Chryseobacterium phage MA9V-2]|nr:hypothetical protein MA9V2_242 [Chryseobacterium phage MA9V-2]
MANKAVGMLWKTALPAVADLLPNSIYFIKPATGVKPGVFVTNNDATQVMQINPDTIVGDFVAKINNIAPTNGNVDLDISFNNTTGVLTFTGGANQINLDARYVKKADFAPWQATTDNRLTALEALAATGLKTPVAFDASANATFPTQAQGFTYKVTVAGTTSGVLLEVGDTIIYDKPGTSNTPYVVQANIDAATTTVKGIIRIATQTEVNNKVVGSLVGDASVTPLTLYYKLNAWLADITASQTDVNTGTRNDVFVTPATLKVRLDTIVASLHTHTNKTQLDKIAEDPGGNMTYGGKPVYTLQISEW